MSQSPNPVDGKMLSRVGAAGAVVGIVLIVSFALLWVIMGEAGVDVFPRLVIAVCAPPGITAALVGTFLLFRQNKALSGD